MLSDSSSKISTLLYTMLYFQTIPIINVSRTFVDFCKNPCTIVRNDVESFITYFNVDLKRIDNNDNNDNYKMYDGEDNIMFLANHQSEADYFIDIYLTQARPIARNLTKYLLPMHYLIGKDNAITFISRDKGRLHIFNEIDKDRESYLPNMYRCLVYPEGHRNYGSKTLKLKFGMIQYAYTNKMPIQIVISANKDKVCNLKTRSVQFNTEIISSYSKVIYPDKYKGYDEFCSEVEKYWKICNDEIFNSRHSYETVKNIVPNICDKYTITRIAHVKILVRIFFFLIIFFYILYKIMLFVFNQFNKMIKK